MSAHDTFDQTFIPQMVQAPPSAIALPALLAGLILGGWVRSWMPESVFRTVVLGVLIATSIAVIVSASGSMT